MFGFIAAFLPWVLYWILVGNTTYLVAVSVAFGVAVVLEIVEFARDRRIGSLEIGSLVFFALSFVSAFLIDDAVIEQWLQPLSNGALFLIALVGVLVGHPFVRSAAARTVDAVTAASDGFRYITTAMTWMWVGVFGVMTASSLIPPIVDGAATIRDAGDALSIVCYWVVPFALFGLAGAVSAAFPGWFDRSMTRLHEAERAGDGEPEAGPTTASGGGAPVDVAGMPGLLLLPEGDAPAGGWPAVACFGGSEGGVDSMRGTAALLARNGLVVLVTAWTDADAEGRPAIERIPLERFGTAIDWLRARPESGAVAALAISRGAEGLLASAAAGLARPDAIVALSPSSVRWQAIGDDGEVPGTGSWSAGGVEAGWLAVRAGELVPQLVRNAWRVTRRHPAGAEPLRLRAAYESALAQARSAERAAGAIDATAIAAPALFAAGEADAIWPGGPMATELASMRRRDDDRLLVIPAAGHLLLPGLSPDQAAEHGGIAMGGTAEGNAAVERELWPAILAFLSERLPSRH